MNETIQKKNFKSMQNAIGKLVKALPWITIIGSFISIMKRNISLNCVTFYKIEQPLHPLPRGPICTSAICGLLNA